MTQQLKTMDETPQYDTIFYKSLPSNLISERCPTPERGAHDEAELTKFCRIRLRTLEQQASVFDHEGSGTLCTIHILRDDEWQDLYTGHVETGFTVVPTPSVMDRALLTFPQLGQPSITIVSEDENNAEIYRTVLGDFRGIIVRQMTYSFADQFWQSKECELRNKGELSTPYLNINVLRI